MIPACRFALLMLGAAVACAQATALDRFVGRDLWADRPTAEERSQLREITGPVPKGYLMEPGPWRVWKTTSGFGMLLVESMAVIPGASSACVQFFDTDSNRIQQSLQCFITGWRSTPWASSFQYSKRLASWVIVLQMEGYVHGWGIAREYFAIDGHRVRLVRLEDHTRKAVPNEFTFLGHEIGPIPLETSEGEWLEMLQSSRKVVALAALQFLGGRHIRDQVRSPHADLFEKLIANPAIRTQVDKLSRSRDRWTREAARLAAADPRDRRVL